MTNPTFKDTLVRLVGWKATLFHGDTLVYDRWRWLQDHLQKGPLRTLDAGCGSGCFSFYASAMGNHVVGLDRQGTSLDSARRRAEIMKCSNLQFVEADLRDLKSRTAELGQFDQIICLEAIEHVKNDQQLIDNLASMLKPGGRILLTTPFKYYHRMVGDVLSEVEDGGHVRWGYTHEEVRAMFLRVGIKVVTQDYISGVVSQQVTNVLRVISRLSSRFAWGSTLPLRFLRPIDLTLTKLMRYPFFSLGVVGIKSKSNA